MKIIFFTKRISLIRICIIYLIVLLLFLIINFPNILSIELDCNSNFSNDFIDKIKNLTNQKDKIAYLTFDDGPTSLVTPQILDILKEQNIKATFFVLGKCVDAHPEIVKRAYEEGHYIANHGYSHNNSILYKDSKSFMNEIKNTDLSIGKAIGVENYCSHIFRFPNGFMARSYQLEKKNAVYLLSEMNYAYIDWNCLNKDSEKKYSTNQLLDNLKQSSKNKNTLVILMHDTKDVNDSSLVLNDSIDYLKSEGYQFKNFYDLMYSQIK